MMIHYMRLLGALLSLIILSSKIHYTDATKVLMVMYQSPYQILYSTAIGEDLIRRGHQVYVAILSGNSQPTGAISKAGIHLLTYHRAPDVLYPFMEEYKDKMYDMITKKTPNDMFFFTMFGDCQAMLSDQSFLGKARALKFDLAVVWLSSSHPCYPLVPHVLGIPFISSAFFMSAPTFRIPLVASFYVPSTMSGVGSFADRLSNVWTFVESQILALNPMWSNTTLLKTFAPDVESWYDLVLRSELIMIENNYLLDTALPLLPHVVTISGCTSRPAEPLPDGLAKIFRESGDNGVILVSFGAIDSRLPTAIVAKFMDAFERLNETVLMQMELSEGMQVPRNVHVMSWLPENDILGRQQTKLFIAHCVITTHNEALYHGVPKLGVPLYGDQFSNCARAEKKGLSLCLNLFDFTADQLYHQIRELIDNATYRTNSQKLSAIWRDEPLIGRQKAGFWIDHVIKHGSAHLRSPAIDQPLYQFLMLDIIAFVFVIAFVVIMCLYTMISWLIRAVEIKYQQTQIKRKFD